MSHVSPTVVDIWTFRQSDYYFEMDEIANKILKAAERKPCLKILVNWSSWRCSMVIKMHRRLPRRRDPETRSPRTKSTEEKWQRIFVQRWRQRFRKWNRKLALYPAAVVLVGNRPDSATYVRMKKKAAAEVELHAVDVPYPTPWAKRIYWHVLRNWTTIQRYTEFLFNFLCQLIDEAAVLKSIRVDKDVDGFSALNIGNLCLRGGDKPLASLHSSRMYRNVETFKCKSRRKDCRRSRKIQHCRHACAQMFNISTPQ